MKKKSALKSAVELSTEKPYKINDRRGTEKQTTYLYPSPSNNSTIYRPRYYTTGDTSKTVTAYDRKDYMNLGRSLFGGCPDLGGALLSKASWCVGPGSFQPIHTGTNKSWGDQAETWLTDQFYPVCSVMGTNYSFTQLLYLSCLALDIDGDNGLFFTTTRNGFPQVGLVPSHRIGCRNGETLVKTGKFQGYKIFDGVIINDAGRTIGYRILGDTAADDYDISSQSFNLLFESEWSDQYRGISRVARSACDWTDKQDIDEFIKRGIKLGASIGLLSKTENGDATDAGANLVGATEDPQIVATNGTLSVEGVNGGEILYMKSSANETIEALKDERPSQNTEAHIERIIRRAMYSIGWPMEMMDASKLGGASVRLVQDLVRKSISSRQTTLIRRAKVIINYALATAMNNGILPQNNQDWYSWKFTTGGVVSVDNGREADIDRENFKIGTTTLSTIASKDGKDWVELREQQQRETEDLLDRAKAISTKYSITMDAALSLLSQRTPNQAPLSGAPQPAV